MKPLKVAAPCMKEEFLSKTLRNALYELSEKITDEQVNKILNPVLEKIRGEMT